MRILKFVFCLFFGLASAASANDYPTFERVAYVLNCMQELGRNSMVDLQTCSCRIDTIATQMSFEEYGYAVTYDRNKRMTGKQGGIFRDNKSGKKFSKVLGEAGELAAGQCKKVVQVVAPTDLTGETRYSEIKAIKDN